MLFLPHLLKKMDDTGSLSHTGGTDDSHMLVFRAFGQGKSRRNLKLRMPFLSDLVGDCSHRLNFLPSQNLVLFYVVTLDPEVEHIATMAVIQLPKPHSRTV